MERDVNTHNENVNVTINVHEIERELNLKRLERIAEDNVNLTMMLQHDLKTTALFSIISLLIGIIIIALKQYFDDSNSPLKITAATIGGSIGGGVLFSSVRNILDNWYNKTSTSIGNDIIGSSEHAIKKRFTQLSKNIYEEERMMKEIINVIKRRNERLQSVRSRRSILMIFSSLILICLVLCSVFFGLYNTKNVNSAAIGYVADAFLIAGGVIGFMQCLVMYFILSNPGAFKKRSFSFFSFIMLYLYGLIQPSQPDQPNQLSQPSQLNQPNQPRQQIHEELRESTKNQQGNGLKEDIKLCYDLYVLRIVLDNDERENIERAIHGLSMNVFPKKIENQ